ncbi:MAG: outer membrane beta-barrel protein, partial [Mucilaginibacter sp.]
YLNVTAGPYSGTEFDLTTAYQITDAFKLGLNAADFSAPHSTGGFEGVALYPQLAISKIATMGIRGEYFKTKAGTYADAGPAPGDSVTGVTFTANIKAGNITLISEIRVDNGSNSMFNDSSLAPTKSASQFLLAAVYAF